MRKKLKKILMVAITPFPSKVKTFILRHLLGFDVSRDAYIGLSLVMCENLLLEEGVIIGHLSVVKGNMTLHMKARSTIGQFNWITGGNPNPSYFKGCDRRPGLVLGEETSITSRHILDCTDGITIGRFTTLAGYRSVILAHGIDYRASKQDCKPINIGDYCLIGSNVTILMGVQVANRTIIGAGSLVAESIEKDLGVWGGVPARRIKELSGEEGYFRRNKGHVY
jgi:acetyltransferase-like isoleucine patch superfamily enzyme